MAKLKKRVAQKIKERVAAAKPKARTLLDEVKDKMLERADERRAQRRKNMATKRDDDDDKKENEKRAKAEAEKRAKQQAQAEEQRTKQREGAGQTGGEERVGVTFTNPVDIDDEDPAERSMRQYEEGRERARAEGRAEPAGPPTDDPMGTPAVSPAPNPPSAPGGDQTGEPTQLVPHGDPANPTGPHEQRPTNPTPSERYGTGRRDPEDAA
jgi:hypothetical protein